MISQKRWRPPPAPHRTINIHSQHIHYHMRHCANIIVESDQMPTITVQPMESPPNERWNIETSHEAGKAARPAQPTISTAIQR